MPWKFERKIIYPTGWCRGPVRYGDQMALDERIWQAYQTVDGRVHLRRANADLSMWEWEDCLPLYEHEGLAQFPDVTFDKAGQPEVAFGKKENGSVGIWVRRITIVDDLRTVIIEKIVDNASRPKLFRDPDGDILLFYIKNPATEGDQATIAYRVQSEGWATERLVAGTQDPLGILDVAIVRDYRLVLTYSRHDNVIGYVMTDRYPIVAIERIATASKANMIKVVPVVRLGLTADTISTNAMANLIEIIDMNLYLDGEDKVAVGALANLLTFIITVEYALTDDVVQAQSKANKILFVPVVNFSGNDMVQVGAKANLLTIEQAI